MPLNKINTAVKSDELKENYENSCVVCFRNVEIYSIGECDHPVCYECSTRMRVLCRQNECPICRQDLSKVIFTTEVSPYRQLEINNRSGLYDKKYRICFSNSNIQTEFYHLLENPCSKCNTTSFISFDLLKKHVSKEHALFYCDICTENLKIFSFERRCYTRTELAQHKRKGDPDNKSHRGHPLCEYCDQRYLDRDELFRHLRREHYFCHFCDADGANHFYGDYDSLRHHFREAHYLCEEGECVTEQFTSVFRTDIDLIAHKASIHSKGLDKNAAKQARTLNLELSLFPRNRQGHNNGESSRSNYRNNRGFELNQDYENDTNLNQNQSQQPTQQPPRLIDAKNEQEFPSLSGSSTTTAVTLIRPNVSIRTKTYGSSGLARTTENFPALGGSGLSNSSNQTTSISASSSSTAGGPTQYSKASASAVLRNTNQPGNNPPNGSKPTSGGMVIHVSNRPKQPQQIKTDNPNDFPALSFSSGRNAKLLLDPDPLPPPSNINLGAVAAKHRTMVEEYASITTATAAPTKLTMIQKEAVNKAEVKPKTDSVPKLNSKESFPALGGPSGNSALSSTPLWVSASTKQKTESRKAKVAPAPNLTASASITTISKKSTESVSNSKNVFGSNNNNAAVIKKDKSGKKKKETKTPPSPASQYETIKTNFKQNEVVKPKKNRENNNSITFDNNNKLTKQPNENEINSEAGKKSKTNNLNVKLNDENFPALSGDLFSSMANKLSPPPGFSISTAAAVKQQANDSVTKPPPGFNSVTLNSVARAPSNNLTFTNSTGDSYSIVPTPYQYISPPGMSKRNQVLVTHFQNALQHPDAVEEFRKISQMFRDSSYHALPYYEHCQTVLGEQFDEIFPELLALLPDIGKQQELYLVHSQNLKEASTNKNKKSNQNKSQKLDVCATCKQVVITSDLVPHLQTHTLENNFPVLSKQNETSTAGWKK